MMSFILGGKVMSFDFGSLGGLPRPAGDIGLYNTPVDKGALPTF